MRAPPLRSNRLPEDPPPNTITLGLEFQHLNLGRTQVFSLWAAFFHPGFLTCCPPHTWHVQYLILKAEKMRCRTDWAPKPGHTPCVLPCVSHRRTGASLGLTDPRGPPGRSSVRCPRLGGEKREETAQLGHHLDHLARKGSGLSRGRGMAVPQQNEEPSLIPLSLVPPPQQYSLKLNTAQVPLPKDNSRHTLPSTCT